MIDWLAAHPARFYIGENVDDVNKGDSDNHAFVTEQLAEAGYVVDVVTLNSSSFGAVTERRRSWILGVHIGLTGLNVEEARLLIRSVFATVDRMKLEGPLLPLQWYLLPADSAYVAQELGTGLQSQDSRQQGETLWQKDMTNALFKAGMTWSSCRVPPDLADRPHYASLPIREQKIIAFYLQKDPGLISVDVSQSFLRNPRGHAGMLPTFTTSSKTFLTDRAQFREVTGLERMWIHGFPYGVLDEQRRRLLWGVADLIVFSLDSGSKRVCSGAGAGGGGHADRQASTLLNTTFCRVSISLFVVVLLVCRIVPSFRMMHVACGMSACPRFCLAGSSA